MPPLHTAVSPQMAEQQEPLIGSTFTARQRHLQQQPKPPPPSAEEAEAALRRRVRYAQYRAPPPPKTTAAAAIMLVMGVTLTLAGGVLWWREPAERERAYAMLAIGGICEWCSGSLHHVLPLPKCTKA